MKREHWLMGTLGALLILLCALCAFLYFNSSFYYSSPSFQDAKEGHLLSLRVYAGLLEPKNHLIMNFAPLKQGIAQYLEDSNLQASVYVVNLRDGASMGINDLRGYVPASLSKVPLAIAIMQKVERGELSMDEQISLTAPLDQASLVSASGDLHRKNLSTLSVRELLEQLLIESDNTAYAALYTHISQEEMASLLSYVDYYSEDKVFDVEKESQRKLITPHSMYRLFSSLYFSTTLTPKNSEYLLSLMSQSSFDMHKIANLPKEAIIAQKYGAHYPSGEAWMHNCGIMYIDEMRLFYCVMTKGAPKEEAQKSIGAIVNSIYRYAIAARSELDTS